jgi:hypothetical protein
MLRNGSEGGINESNENLKVTITMQIITDKNNGRMWNILPICLAQY